MIRWFGTPTRAMTFFLHRSGILHAVILVAYEYDIQWIGKSTTSLHYDSAARFRLTSRSSAIVSLIPLPLGSETQGFGLSPMTKMLVILDTLDYVASMKNTAHRVAKVRSIASFTCTISKSPMCFSRCTITPARPMLRPPVIMTRFPVSNLAMPTILF
jgi:hypothetical protein